MKKIFVMLLMTIFCTIVSAAVGDTFSVGPCQYLILSEDDKTVEVIILNKGRYSTDLMIPETVENEGTTYTVVSIGNNAYKQGYNEPSLESIQFPPSIRSIGYWAFQNCDGLKS